MKNAIVSGASYSPDGTSTNSFYANFARALSEKFHREIEAAWEDTQFEMISYMIAALKQEDRRNIQKEISYFGIWSILTLTPRNVPEPPFSDLKYSCYLDVFVDWIAHAVDAAMKSTIQTTRNKFIADQWDLELIKAFLLSEYDYLLAALKEAKIRELYAAFRVVLKKCIVDFARREHFRG